MNNLTRSAVWGGCCGLFVTFGATFLLVVGDRRGKLLLVLGNGRLEMVTVALG